MTREEAREAANIMLAYANGKEIEIHNKSYDNKAWAEILCPNFDWHSYDYRAKKEPKYRPYTFEEFKIDVLKGNAFLKKKNKDEYFCAFDFSSHGVFVVGNFVKFKDLFDKYTWIDGTPCGVLE